MWFGCCIGYLPCLEYSPSCIKRSAFILSKGLHFIAFNSDGGRFGGVGFAEVDFTRGLVYPCSEVASLNGIVCMWNSRGMFGLGHCLYCVVHSFSC